MTSSAIRPSARMTTRSARAAACGSWVTMTTDWPSESTAPRMKSSICGARPRVEVAGRFVGDEDLGLGHQRPGDGDPLLLAPESSDGWWARRSWIRSS